MLATGGFIHNDGMLAAYAPLALRCSFRVGAEGDDGSGIRLGIAAGAATLHMDAVDLAARDAAGAKRGILVDAQGQRFVNEDAYYGRLGELALLQRGGRAWLVVDDAVFEKPGYGAARGGGGRHAGRAERELGLPEAARGDARALQPPRERGEDPVFHKDPRYVSRSRRRRSAPSTAPRTARSTPPSRSAACRPTSTAACSTPTASRSRASSPPAAPRRASR